MVGARFPVAAAPSPWHHPRVDAPGTPEEMLDEARTSVAHRVWDRAYERYSTVAATRPLDADDLERFAKSAYWLGRSNESITLREAAYVAYLERGDDQRAALCALTLRREHIANMQDSVAAALAETRRTAARGTARVVRGHRSGGRLPGDRACRRRPGAWGLRAGARDWSTVRCASPRARMTGTSERGP